MNDWSSQISFHFTIFANSIDTFKFLLNQDYDIDRIYSYDHFEHRYDSIFARTRERELDYSYDFERQWDSDDEKGLPNTITFTTTTIISNVLFSKVIIVMHHMMSESLWWRYLVFQVLDSFAVLVRTITYSILSFLLRTEFRWFWHSIKSITYSA